MVDMTRKRLHMWNLGGNEVAKFSFNNASEKKVEKILNSKYQKSNAEFECTQRDAPQDDYLAEIEFATMQDKGKVLIFDANLPKKMRHILFSDAFQIATKIDGLVLHEMSGEVKSRDEQCTSKFPYFEKCLRVRGESCAVTLKTKTKPK